MTKGEDFIAILKYKTIPEGGRSSHVISGYRAQVKFSFTEMQTSGRQTFIDREMVYPGDMVRAYIKIGSPHLFEHLLIEGMEYEFREGAKTIGTGTIITILNPLLNKNTSK